MAGDAGVARLTPLGVHVPGEHVLDLLKNVHKKYFERNSSREPLRTTAHLVVPQGDYLHVLPLLAERGVDDRPQVLPDPQCFVFTASPGAGRAGVVSPRALVKPSA